jgi:hypothetical protein
MLNGRMIMNDEFGKARKQVATSLVEKLSLYLLGCTVGNHEKS